AHSYWRNHGYVSFLDLLLLDRIFFAGVILVENNGQAVESYYPTTFLLQLTLQNKVGSDDVV
ncbi:hypothetical protein AALP_AAs55157U000100, partial [Arabis alpina]